MRQLGNPPAGNGDIHRSDIVNQMGEKQMNMKKYTVETVVDEENTALAVGSGDMEVFATPMMIALMENAAAACSSDEL